MICWYRQRVVRCEMEYKLLADSSADDLSEEVNEYLRKGWILYGLPMMAPVEGYAYSRFAQAVIRYESQTTEEE